MIYLHTLRKFVGFVLLAGFLPACAASAPWQWQSSPAMELGLGPVESSSRDHSRLRGMRVHIHPSTEDQVWAFRASLYDDRDGDQELDPNELLHQFQGTGAGSERILFPQLHLPGQPRRLAAQASFWGSDGHEFLRIQPTGSHSE